MISACLSVLIAQSKAPPWELWGKGIFYFQFWKPDPEFAYIAILGMAQMKISYAEAIGPFVSGMMHRFFNSTISSSGPTKWIDGIPNSSAATTFR